jgi:hypothetical protein
MADAIDQANDLAAAEAAAGIAKARNADHPVGRAGDCDGCGDHFERLVLDKGGWRCGFCRDGRRGAR